MSNKERDFSIPQLLPIWRTVRSAGSTVTFRSERISALTGLKHLWIAFSGYWPEKEAFLVTESFKELEASCVLGRIPAGNCKILTVSSAGNTAAAFAHICTENDMPCLTLIPESALYKMRFSTPLASCVKVVAITGSGDYTDAIRAAECVTKLDRSFSEGGAKNIARCEGLRTVLLNVFEIIGRLHDSIGSATGAIAAHETAKRLSLGLGVVPRLYLSQNLPFVPIVRSWREGSRN